MSNKTEAVSLLQNAHEQRETNSESRPAWMYKIEILMLIEEAETLIGKAGFGEVRLICESTGIYHHNLLQAARRNGMRTNLVHGEAVSKYRTMQFHDHGKTDARDSQAILTLAKVGRLIKDRVFDSEYAQLRELHSLIMRSALPLRKLLLEKERHRQDARQKGDGLHHALDTVNILLAISR